MRLFKRKPHLSLISVFMAVLVGLFVWFAQQNSNAVADDDNSNDSHFVTFHDQGNKLTVKTRAITVKEAIERANVKISETDKVEPGLTDFITEDTHINIYRSRPALVIDGIAKKYVMTASFDPKTIAEDAGFTIYDGDDVSTVPNTQFMETGDVAVYKITRNGGRTITIETTIPYEEEVVTDSSLAEGEEEVRQAGVEGRRVAVYEVNFVDGIEVSRELISDDVVVEPIKKITAVGGKSYNKAVPPEWETCASWARQAGVAEGDIYVALTLIYHESGCRVDAANAGGSGAYGIPQALPGSKMASAGADWETNPVTQIRWMADYVTRRYGGWAQAMDFWWQHHWY